MLILYRGRQGPRVGCRFVKNAASKMRVEDVVDDGISSEESVEERGEPTGGIYSTEGFDDQDNE